jgi:dTDP-4-dehydrorhamnose 3,5-epimerase
MIKIETGFEGLCILEPQVFADDRGYFLESYNEEKLKNLGITNHFIQDNESKSSFGVVRGLHFQKGEFAQAKLVRVIQGEVIDSVVDLREDSKTFGKSFSVSLSADNKRQFMVPRGFAHGFSVVSEVAIFAYKVDNVYNKASEASLYPFDKDLAIDWQIKESEALLSLKDKEAISFKEYKENINNCNNV